MTAKNIPNRALSQITGEPFGGYCPVAADMLRGLPPHYVGPFIVERMELHCRDCPITAFHIWRESLFKENIAFCDYPHREEDCSFCQVIAKFRKWFDGTRWANALDGAELFSDTPLSGQKRSKAMSIYEDNFPPDGRDHG